MLLAPFTLTELPSRRATSDAPRTETVPSWLIAWAVIGSIAVLCIPALRGGSATGLTLPFWLVAAPMLNIVWLKRAPLLRRLRHRIA